MPTAIKRAKGAKALTAVMDDAIEDMKRRRESVTLPSSIFKAERQEDFTTYKVTLSFDNWIMGGVPQRIDIIEGWLRKGIGVTDDEELKQKALETLRSLFPDKVVPGMTYEEAVEVTKELAEGHVNTFKRGTNGVLYIESRQVKAMLKEAINIRYPKERVAHGKGAKNFTAERVFVAPDIIELGVKQPSGRHLFVGHVTDQRGERSTLTYYDYVERPSLSFNVLVQSTAVDVLEKMWPFIWITAEKNGLGALRSQGFGTFAVTEWSKVK